jgi:hypothetical protein
MDRVAINRVVPIAKDVDQAEYLQPIRLCLKQRIRKPRVKRGIAEVADHPPLFFRQFFADRRYRLDEESCTYPSALATASMMRAYLRYCSMLKAMRCSGFHSAGRANRLTTLVFRAPSSP